MTKTEQIVKKLEADNPQLIVVWGTKHIKLLINGAQVGILPYRLRTEGLARPTVSQLRRAGLTV
jgi:hypothetical protein